MVSASSTSTLSYVSIAGGSLMAEKLPLSYCQSWPLWCTSAVGDGRLAMRRVNPSADGDDERGSWVDPLTFEDMWLPEDLPFPSFHLALTLVLKDGTPRYVAPGLDSTVASAGREWRNRGLCSVPMAKTWLPWRHTPIAQMRLSAYVQPPTPPDAPADGSDGARCQPLAVLVPVEKAFEMAAEVLADAPSELANGFSYLTVRLPLDDESLLASAALVPGARLRVFLSDAESFPTALGSSDDSWAWERGECDVRLMQVSPGGTSAYLPDVYRPLFENQKLYTARSGLVRPV
ncbi:hypothetical protein KFE25_000312 [Diacronema lutheri]|uniref:Uncharacterized protein n=2 Tax=Diacronema lutheri TaxID=2081491 RepID=A0A8J5XAL8_DIALT|nr:hypothetical protein KFE25_010438 [Diacronema lutheri]KAG8464144.1 hypothetical protein KFE25_000312 [Diacronema lutheri]